MDNTVFMSKSNGVFTAEEQDQISTALATQAAVDQFTAQAAVMPQLQQLASLPALQPGAAIDWTTIITQVLPIIFSLFTGGGAGGLISFINLFLQIFKLPPLPTPTPTPTPVPPTPTPAPFIVPTPVP